jgi:hypothetical protein
MKPWRLASVGCGSEAGCRFEANLVFSEPAFLSDGSALRDLLDVAIHRLPAKYRVPVLRWRLRRPRLPYRLR